MPKKFRTITTYKKLLRKAEELWKQCAKKRDKMCQVCGSDHLLAVDHCFSRTIKALFLDVSNSTVLCGHCHTLKSFRVKGYEKKVDEIVRTREGEKWWKYALEVAFSHKPKKFSIDELENEIKKMKEYLNEN